MSQSGDDDVFFFNQPRRQRPHRPSMLPSPPLTADSCPSPRSLKRTFTDATDDYTPPDTPPLKRRRCQSFVFDPSSLITPPEYTHTPYDPEFGKKVCRQYRKSLIVQSACDAVNTRARRQKYGEKAAMAHSPGSTPDCIRRSYEDEQRRLDEVAAEIIANSESEPEPDHEDECRDPLSKHNFRSDLFYEPGGSCLQHGSEQHTGGVLRAAQSAQAYSARTQSALRIGRSRRKYRLQGQHRSSVMVGS